MKDYPGPYPGTVPMIATQVSDGTQGLTRPIMALYGDSGCTESAWGYVQQGRCHYIDSLGLSVQSVCLDGKSQQCTWHNSTTCPANTTTGTRTARTTRGRNRRRRERQLQTVAGDIGVLRAPLLERLNILVGQAVPLFPNDCHGLDARS